MFSCTIVPSNVSSSTTLAVGSIDGPLIAIWRPFDADWTRHQALPSWSMIGLADAEVIFVPLGLCVGRGLVGLGFAICVHELLRRLGVPVAGGVLLDHRAA